MATAARLTRAIVRPEESPRNVHVKWAEIEEGAISTSLVHLANISYRLRRSVNFDAKTYTCPGDKEATAMFTRQYRRPFVVPQTV